MASVFSRPADRVSCLECGIELTKEKRQESNPVEHLVVLCDEFLTLHNECFPGRWSMYKSGGNKCRVCGEVFRKKERMDHVLKEHMIKGIYHCSLCSLSSTSDQSNVITVGNEEHDGNAVTLNIVGSMKKVIVRVGSQCFPDWSELDEEIKRLL